MTQSEQIDPKVIEKNNFQISKKSFQFPRIECKFCGRPTNHSTNGKVCLVCGNDVDHV